MDFREHLSGGFDVDFVFNVLACTVSALKKFEFWGQLPSKFLLQRFAEANPWILAVSVIDHPGSYISIQNKKCQRDVDLDVGTAVKVFCNASN